MDKIQLYLGDCFEITKIISDKSIDTVITDPPYGLKSIVKRFGKKNSAPAKEGKDGRFRRLSKGFMGQEWDGSGIETDIEFWKEVLRVTKPGGNALVFGGTRTYHRIACAMEDAGWILNDVIMWIHGQGFPKSLNINKSMIRNKDENFRSYAEKWDGWGTGLCPSYEPIIVAMKPLDGTFAENAIKWGVAGLWIDGGRIATDDDLSGETYGGIFSGSRNPDGSLCKAIGSGDKGRWAKNVIFSHLPECKVVGTKRVKNRAINHFADDEIIELYECVEGCPVKHLEEQKKGVSRFFYCSKASKREKNEGLEDLGENIHPTVKPIDLMRYLCKLTRTPNGGIVFDPFMGTGTTAIGCLLSDRGFVGVEKQKEYYEISQKRIAYWIESIERKKLTSQLKLDI